MSTHLSKATSTLASLMIFALLSACGTQPNASSLKNTEISSVIQTAENSNNFGVPNYKINDKDRAILTLPQKLRDPNFEPPRVTAKGTRIIDNPLESENMVTHPELRKGRPFPDRFPNRTKKGYNVLTASTSHSWWGTQILQTPNYYAPYAVAARHTVNKYQTLPYNGGGSVDAIFAPTLIGPNDCSLEALTAYTRYPLSTGSGVNFAVYDHYNGLNPFSYKVFMDATTTTFATHYLDTNSQYQVDIEHFSNGYTSVYLYDNVYHAWALMFSEQYGQAGYNTNNGVNRLTGWEMFEVYYYNYDPGTITQIKMNNLQMDRGDGNGIVWAAKSAVNGVPANSIEFHGAESGQIDVVYSWYTHQFYSASPYLTDWRVSNP